LNASQLITLPLPTIPSNYDDYKEGDESFDPFYRDVPKIRNDQRLILTRKHDAHKRNLRKKRSMDYDQSDESYPSGEVIFNAEIKDIKDLRANLPIIKAILFGLPIPESEELSKTEVLNMNNTHNNTNNESNQTLTFNNETPEEIVNNRNVNNRHNNTSTDMQYSLLQIQKENKENSNLNISNIKENKNIQSSTSNEFEAITQIANDAQILKNPTFRIHTEHQTTFNPLIVKHDNINVQPEVNVQLFLKTNAGNNSQSINMNSSIPFELKNSLNKTIDINNNTRQLSQELLQTRSSMNSKKSNRRKNLSNESMEESEEYLARRNNYNNKPKSTRYYDEYDIDENVEINSRPRSHRLRQRPKDRRIANYRHDYLDEDDNENDEYFLDNINNDHKNRQRLRPQSSRVFYRNRNRYFDYEDDFELHEKSKVTSKTLNSPSRIRESTRYDSSYEGRRRRPEVTNRKNRRRPTLISTEEIQIKELDSKSRHIESPAELHLENKNIRYSLRNEENRENQALMKAYLNDSRKDEESAEQKDIIEDHTNKRKKYSDEYNESDELNISDDYVDYSDFRNPVRETLIENRRNRNRFDNEFDIIPERKSIRQNKSRKIIEEKEVDLDKIEEKVNNKYIESTSLQYDKNDKITNAVIANKVSSDSNGFKEYDDYHTVRLISTTDNIENPELLERTKISTEGVFKFTDELPPIEKNEEAQKDDKQTYELSMSEEDYVDDNYEPDSYLYPAIEEPLSSLQKFTEENDERVLNINDQPTDTMIDDTNKTLNNSEMRVETKTEYDDLYEDKLENTTTSFSSQEYDNLEITTNSFYSTITDTISISTADPTLPSIKKSTVNTLTPVTTAVPILETMVTTINTPTSATFLARTPNATTSTTMNYVLTTPITNTPATTITAAITTTNIPTLTDTITPIFNTNFTTSKSTITTTSPMLAMITTSTTTRTKATAKFFKPISLRKNYTYIPPPTKPNSVVIRRGHPLSGPKPTKPPPSYNDLAPKPLIRRLPLLSRTTTSTPEPTISDDEIILELPQHVSQNKDKNIKENKTSVFNNKNESSVFEAVIDYPLSELLPSSQLKNNKIVDKDPDSTIMNFNNATFVRESSSTLAKNNQTTYTNDSNLDNEVPIQSPRLNNTSKTLQSLKDIVNETSQTKSALNHSNQNILQLETTTKQINLHTNVKTSDVSTTTIRTVKFSEYRKLELTSVKSQIQKSNQSPKPTAGFNCLEKEMYRFYGDVRDCRLFHYCSPGFTVRQVLDFRFVCEEGTIFDEESQSCRHDVPNAKCIKRIW
jgi:hypothetical protein